MVCSELSLLLAVSDSINGQSNGRTPTKERHPFWNSIPVYFLLMKYALIEVEVITINYEKKIISLV